ncbi:MAG: hypothetical protein ACLFTN_06110 [Phycisphaerae bacterium]
MTTPLPYRSVSFHESWPRPELIALAARLGFNDCTFQTEKGTLPRLRDLRARADEQGFFEQARREGMTISVWTHELGEPGPEWRPFTPDNDALWKGLDERYEYVLGELLPEIDHLVLTVVEAGVDIADSKLLPRLVETINNACRRHDAQLILRSFVHHPEQHQQMADALRALPPDVAVLTKCVPQDWHMRADDDPLIGALGERTQYIECDIAGEYWQEDRLANAFTHILARQVRHWQANGADGISVRVDRGWKPWEHQATVLNQAQEVNLWLLGLFATGETDSEDEVWRRFTAEHFADATGEMEQALRPTGRVVEEASYVGREAFGLLRLPVSVRETFEGGPSWKRGELRKGLRRPPTAEAYEDSDDAMYRNPFFGYSSVHRWNPQAAKAYRAQRRGEPDAIEANERSLAEAAETAENCLAALDAASPKLHAAVVHHYRWQLEENAHYLHVMGQMQLAWMKAERSLYCDDHAEREQRLEQVEVHLNELARWQALHGDETWRGTWDHRHQERSRLAGVDVPEFLRGFRRYFGL